MSSFNAKNPMRPPNWRWERALYLRSAGRSRTNGEDEWIRQAIRFQAAMERNPEAVDQMEVAEAFPDIYYASTLYRRPGTAEAKNPLRFAIEARILADQTDEEIAQAAGVDPTLIVWYEKLFFNVREKLLNNDYILTVAIGPAIYTGMNEREYDLLWKVFGYVYGPKVLDAFIKSTTKPFRPKDDAETEACIVADIKSSLRRKAMIAARTFAINNFSQSELLNVYTRFLEIEKEGESGSAKDFFLTNVGNILARMPWVAAATNMDQSTVGVYDKQGAELRTEELLDAATGTQPTDAAALADLKFPEPKSNEQAQQT
jgi:hypothetical protein